MFELRHQPRELRQRLARVARATGHPPEAVFLVLYSTLVACRGLPDCWWNPTSGQTIPDDGPITHLTAVQVCDAICRCARARVGADAVRYFHLWGLKTGTDVGRIVYALIDEGLGAATDGDRIEQFDRIPLLRLLRPIREVEDEDEE